MNQIDTQRFYRFFQKGTIEILFLLRDNPENYNTIINQLKKHNISRSWLAIKLKDLLKEDILSRELIDEIPPKTIYSLTERGKKILDLIVEFSSTFLSNQN